MLNNNFELDCCLLGTANDYVYHSKMYHQSWVSLDNVFPHTCTLYWYFMVSHTIQYKQIFWIIDYRGICVCSWLHNTLSLHAHLRILMICYHLLPYIILILSQLNVSTASELSCCNQNIRISFKSFDLSVHYWHHK